MGAASAIGGYIALRAIERAVGKKNGEQENPAPTGLEDARLRLLAAATGNPGLAMPQAERAVKKRTIIEEIEENLDE
jgi:hypothetical protein